MCNTAAMGAMAPVTNPVNATATTPAVAGTTGGGPTAAFDPAVLVPALTAVTKALQALLQALEGAGLMGGGPAAKGVEQLGKGGGSNAAPTPPGDAPKTDAPKADAPKGDAPKADGPPKDKPGATTPPPPAAKLKPDASGGGNAAPAPAPAPAAPVDPNAAKKTELDGKIAAKKTAVGQAQASLDKARAESNTQTGIRNGIWDAAVADAMKNNKTNAEKALADGRKDFFYHYMPSGELSKYKAAQTRVVELSTTINYSGKGVQELSVQLKALEAERAKL
ncbi:MAG: hypothetical protein JWM90_352 [Thermoleophilia bacterium]|nr:hypothetical protein [Thermoleophilia bacterium]